MNFNEYKKNKSMKDAYRESVKIQENFALTSMSIGSTFSKPYEGHIAVSDIISKIDATTRMFETYMKDDSFSESIPKIINIIENLYDLAQVKLTEAKNKAIEYMQKASGQSDLADISQEQESDILMKGNRNSRYNGNSNGNGAKSSNLIGPKNKEQDFIKTNNGNMKDSLN